MPLTLEQINKEFDTPTQLKINELRNQNNILSRLFKKNTKTIEILLSK